MAGSSCPPARLALSGSARTVVMGNNGKRHRSRTLVPVMSQLRVHFAALEAENQSLRAELSSRNGETHFRQVIDASPVPLSVDDMKGTIEYINRKFEEKFGYSHKEIPTSAAWFARAYPSPMYRRQVSAQ